MAPSCATRRACNSISLSRWDEPQGRWAGSKHPTSNTQHPTSNAEESVRECIGCWMLNVGCWMFVRNMSPILNTNRNKEGVPCSRSKRAPPARAASRDMRPTPRSPFFKPARQPASDSLLLQMQQNFTCESDIVNSPNARLPAAWRTFVLDGSANFRGRERVGGRGRIAALCTTFNHTLAKAVKIWNGCGGSSSNESRISRTSRRTKTSRRIPADTTFKSHATDRGVIETRSEFSGSKARSHPSLGRCPRTFGKETKSGLKARPIPSPMQRWTGLSALTPLQGLRI